MSYLGARVDELMKVRPSPSMLVALTALFVALAGNAVAGTSRIPLNSVGSAQIKPGAVATSDLAANSVQPSKIPTGAIRASELAPGAVGPTAIAPNAVTTPAIAPAAVQTASIAPEAINASRLQTDAVTSGKIQPGAVTTAALAPEAVTGPKIGPAAVLASKIQDQAVGTSQLSNAIPSASAVKTTSTTWNNNGYTALTFPTETYDTANLHGGAVPAYRMKAPVAGIYQITVVATWANDGCGGTRSLEFDGRRADDSTPFLPVPYISSTVPASATSTTTQSLTGMMQLAAGESVEIWGGAGGMSCATTTTVGSPGASLTMSWIAPGP